MEIKVLTLDYKMECNLLDQSDLAMLHHYSGAQGLDNKIVLYAPDNTLMAVTGAAWLSFSERAWKHPQTMMYLCMPDIIAGASAKEGRHLVRNRSEDDWSCMKGCCALYLQPLPYEMQPSKGTQMRRSLTAWLPMPC